MPFFWCQECNELFNMSLWNSDGLKSLSATAAAKRQSVALLMEFLKKHGIKTESQIVSQPKHCSAIRADWRANINSNSNNYKTLNGLRLGTQKTATISLKD